MTPIYKTFQKLMGHRIASILIVSSPYDAFIMEEDGGMLEHVFANYRGISLTKPPSFTVVSTAKEALSAIKKEKFDLVIVIVPQYLGMDPILLGKKIKNTSPELPVVLLAHGMKGFTQYTQNELPKDSIDNVFVWSGNRNIMWTIIKWLEDRVNVDHDSQYAKVRVLILIEDSPYYYSSLLPILYKAIVHQTQAIIDESLNEEHRLWKLRARTKILLAKNYEEAMDLYNRFKPYLIAVFSDTRYPREGQIDEEAGLRFIKHLKNELPALPVLLLSTDSVNRQKAYSIEAAFQDKNSPSLHLEILRFMIENMGFGDFIFRLPNGLEVARASNLLNLEKVLPQIPDESLSFHVSRNHFSNWLMARSEITLASKFGQVTPADFNQDMEAVRRFLIESLHARRIEQQRGVIALFKPEDYDSETEFLRLGDGSLGGKARGLAFMLKYLSQNQNTFSDLGIDVVLPNTLVLTTDCYDQFIEENHLQEYSKIECADEEVAAKFAAAKLPENIEINLRTFLEKNPKVPLAIRSSSLLEDSKDWPYAGLYSTYMIPNDHVNFHERLAHLLLAIRLVYASVFFESPKAFARTTQHRTEEEKMAVVIQPITGEWHGEYYYPTFSGVAQSYNFYPLSPMKAEDGIAQISMGLGKIVVEGGQAIRFCPKYPQVILQFADVEETLRNAQQFFYAIKHEKELGALGATENEDVIRREVSDAIFESPIKFVASTYYPQDHLIRDVVPTGKWAVPVVTFANILKYNQLPIAELISRVLEMGKHGFGCDVEIEFAVNISHDPNVKTKFVLLQTRPLTTRHQNFCADITKEDIKNSIIYSTNALGKTLTTEIKDIVFVKPETFSGKNTIQIAEEISQVNSILLRENRKFLLIGPGRWGSSDKNLGVPVKWKDISSVGGIVEAATENFKADPSQGTHFFQNITSLGIIYFTVRKAEDKLNWKWLYKQEVVSETEFIRHVRLTKSLNIKINGKKSQGVILTDGFSTEAPTVARGDFTSPGFFYEI